MKTKESTFSKELQKKIQELDEMESASPEVVVPSEKTTKIMDYTDDFMKNKEIVGSAKDLSKAPVGELTPDQKEMMQLRNLMGNINMNKRLGELGMSSYSKQVPGMLKQAKALASKLAGKAGKAALVAAPVIANLSDALASEDLGAGEESEIAEMKRQKQLEQLIPKQIREKSEELARMPLTAGDLLEKESPATKMMKEELDDKSQKSVGEQESPDLEEMDKVMNYEDYLKKKKRQLGYE